VALAVEMLHAASLLHDDLIDDAETRRGAAAAFRRYGNVVSVMSGDFMLARVLGLLARSGSSAFTLLMSETAARICEGEVLQFQAATLETHDRRRVPPRDRGEDRGPAGDGARGRRRCSRARPSRSAPRCAASGWPTGARSRCRTTCSTCSATRPNSASPSAATCARARRRCRCSSC
jgi:hypothetical protein